MAAQAGNLDILESGWNEALVANRPVIFDQAYGDSLDPDRLERLGRYEGHLVRNLERTLSMLLKLKDLRSG